MAETPTAARHAVTPYLVVRGADDAIAFYRKAFGAKELFRMPGPDGKSIMHAEVRIGDAPVYLADEFPDMGFHSPLHYGGTGAGVHLYVDDVDAMYDQAVAAGATPLMPPVDAFWGDRYGSLTDPFGHRWSLATHKEDLSPEEMARRMEAEMKQMPCPQ